MSRKLKPGKKVCIGGRTYKEFVPESVIKSLELSDDIFVQEKPKTASTKTVEAKKS